MSAPSPAPLPSIRALLQSFARRETRPIDVLDHCLDAIRRHNSAVNALPTRRPDDELRAQAPWHAACS